MMMSQTMSQQEIIETAFWLIVDVLIIGTIIAVIIQAIMPKKKKNISRGKERGNWKNALSLSGFVRVEKTMNEEKQMVYRLYRGEKLQLEIFARKGNIWDNTSRVLLTNSNMSPENIMIDADGNVYGIEEKVMKNGRILEKVAVQFETGVGEESKPMYLTDYPNVIEFQTASNGVGIGIFTKNGLYNLELNQIVFAISKEEHHN